MSLALAIIALLASLGALWVAAEASKRAEGQQKKFVDAHLINIKQSITDLRIELNNAHKRVDQLEERLKGAASGSSGEVEQMKQELAMLKNSLGAMVNKLNGAGTAAMPPSAQPPSNGNIP